MKKRLLILVVILWCATGCTIKYDLVVDEDNTFKEKIEIESYVSESKSKEDLYDEYLEEYPIYIDQEYMYYDPYSKKNDYTYYKKSYKDLENGYLFIYQDEIPYAEINRARTLNTLFNTVNIGYIEEYDYYFISAKDPKIWNNNKELDSIKIQITFNNWDVISNNAADNINQTYIWNLAKDSENVIEIKYKKKDVPKSENNDKKENNEQEISNGEKENTLVDYILLGAILLLYVIGIVGLIKYRSINK